MEAQAYKLNFETMATHMEEALETFRKKNAAYGNSFETSIRKFGYVAALVRMNDKTERLLALLQNPDLDQFGEALADTATDLGNYAHMLAVILKGDCADGKATDEPTAVRGDSSEHRTYAEQRVSMGITNGALPGTSTTGFGGACPTPGSGYQPYPEKGKRYSSLG